MRQFKNYIENKESSYDFEDLVLEFMDSENFVPKNGIWVKSYDDSWYYYFDVEGDSCEDIPSNYRGQYKGRCYALNLSGDPSNHTGISFYRSGSTSDSGRGVQINLTKTILHAISEFIEKKKPRYFSWSAVMKTRANAVQGRVINQHARRKLYEKFFIDKFFPDYIPLSSTNWTSRENYDKFYVPYGYAPIPEDIKNNTPRSQKIQVIEDLENFRQGNANEISRKNYERNDAEYRDQMEQVRQKQREKEEKIQKILNDPQQNPEQIKVSDLVDVKYSENIAGTETEISTVGIVKEFVMSTPDGGPTLSDEKLSAIVSLSEDDGDNFYGPSKTIPLSELKKETEESKAARKEKNRRKLEVLLGNSELNPNNVDENDQVIVFISRNLSARENGLTGTIEKITFKKEYYSQGNLYAKINWDEASIQKLRSLHRNGSELVILKHLIKNTPDAEREIQRKKREVEIEDQISRRQRLHSRRSDHDQDISQRLNQTPEEIERLTNHPNNPNRIKPNDFVKIINGYNRNKKGTVVSVRSYAYDENRLVATIKLHRSYRVLSEPLYNIEKDTSENAVRIQNRQRRRQEIGSMSRGFQIGDMVKVTSGRHRDKTGRILSFRLVNNILSVVLTPIDGRNFSVKIDFIERTNSHGLPEANLTFRQYVGILESV